MSARTPHVSRSTAVGAVVGLILLGLLVAFSVGLADDEAGGDPISLPRTLPGGWTAVDTLVPTVGDPSQAAEFADTQARATDYVNRVLADTYEGLGQGGPPRFRAYATSDLASYVTVIAFDGVGGTFAPNGFNDPTQVGLARPPVEMVRDGAVLCQVNWTPIQAGQPVPDDDEPVATSCQLTEGDRTLQLGARDLSVAASADLLRAVADAR